MPTRELASQTARECKKLAKGKKFYIRLMTKQLANTGEFSKLPCDILISTPLRLKSAVNKRKLDLSRLVLSLLVLQKGNLVIFHKIKRMLNIVFWFFQG